MTFDYLKPIADIIITTYNRKEFLKITIESLIEKTGVNYRLFIFDDCSTDGTQEYLLSLKFPQLKEIHLGNNKMGVVGGFNNLWNTVRFYDRFFEDVKYLCYLQDDCEILEYDWLNILIEFYEELNVEHNIGFFSAYDSYWHPFVKRMRYKNRDIYFKISTSAQNLIAEKSFWKSINYEEGEIPRLNPDGSVRGYPNKGRGSHIDIYLTGCMTGSIFVPKNASPNCSYLQKKKIMVIPMIKHLGEDKGHSTWRK